MGGAAAVNLNTATKDELSRCPGIGPAKAQAILDYRAANGGFKSVEELKDVKGIGAKRFEKLKAELTVTPPPKVASAAGKADARSDAKRWMPRRDAEGPKAGPRRPRATIKPVRRPKAKK